MALVTPLETEIWDKMKCDNCDRTFLTQEGFYAKYCPYCLCSKVNKECEMEFVAGELPLIRLGELEDEVQEALSALSDLDTTFEDLADQIRKMKEKPAKEIKEKPNDKSRPETT